jgi:hypothetical protein
LRIRTCVLVSLSLLSFASLLTGCSANFNPMNGTTAPETAIGTIQGIVHGGHQPDIGAAVYVYQTGVAGYKTASKSLLGSYTTGNWPTTADTNGNYYVTTDANGNFNISSEYTCTSGTQVYIYVLGGNTGGGSPNANAGFLAVLGQCPASGTFAGTIANVYVNEVSTVAAAYALSGYAADATHIGGPALTDTLGQTGIKNAALTASNLFNIQSTGSSPTALLTTPGGNGTVPQATLDSLANSLAACVNTTGSNSTTPTACNTLFADALSGGTTGTTPTDTASAAINIAHNPASNVTAIYNLATGTAIAYAPLLSAAPNDWTICIIYTGGGLTAPMYTDSPNTLAIDAGGNIWNVNYTAATLSEFNNLGVPIVATAYATGTGPYAVAIDTAGDAWTTNLGSNNLTEVAPGGTVTNVATANLSDPTGIAFDGSGNMFIASAGASAIVKATSTGTYTAKSTTVEGLDFPYAIAVEPGSAGAIWVTNGSSRYVSYLTNALAGTSEFKLSSGSDVTAGVAVDASGNAWAGVAPASNVTGQLEKITTSNVGNAYTPGSKNYFIADYNGVAVDGGGNIWSADSDNGNIYEVSSAGVTLSGTYGFVVTGNTACTVSTCTTDMNVPQSVGIDESGNVWYDMVSDSTIRELVGASVPTIDPIAATVANSTIGTEP